MLIFYVCIDHVVGNILLKAQRSIYCGSEVMALQSLLHLYAIFCFVDNHGGNIWPNQPRPPSPVSMLVFGLCGPQQPALAQH